VAGLESLEDGLPAQAILTMQTGPDLSKNTILGFGHIEKRDVNLAKEIEITVGVISTEHADVPAQEQHLHPFSVSSPESPVLSSIPELKAMETIRIIVDPFPPTSSEHEPLT
jgi:hypothetical protein